MQIGIGEIFGIVGVLCALAALFPFLRASDRKAEHARSLAGAQQQALYIDTLSRERNDLQAKVTDLEKRVAALEERNDQLNETIERAMRHG